MIVAGTIIFPRSFLSVKNIAVMEIYGARDLSRLTVRIELSDDGLDDRSSGRHVTSSNRHLRNRIFGYLDSRDFRVF